jgi:dGTPase
MATSSRVDIDPHIERKIKRRFREGETLLNSKATKDSAFLRRDDPKDEDFLRLPYSRDSDRILHSKAYSRYIDKTQVFYLIDNDHITHRVLHIQLVSKIARTIGRALGLNEDLIEAISLGHDIGHAPYGHFGEHILSCLSEDKFKIGKFSHNVQAIRFLDKIENLHLTVQVLDGILCHDGEIHVEKLSPTHDVSWKSFDSKLNQAEAGKRNPPMTLEGCVVRFADSISYLGRDIQDARELGLLDDDELKECPQICKDLFDLHKRDCEKINWVILDTLIKDIINNSYDKDSISFSSDYSKGVEKLKDFNKNHIYYNQKLHEDDDKISNMFETLFDGFLSDFKKGKKSSPIFKDMYDLNWVSDSYKKSISPEELVRDYIAGMTDRYFNKKFFDITTLMPIRKEHF